MDNIVSHNDKEPLLLLLVNWLVARGRYKDQNKSMTHYCGETKDSSR